MTELTDEERKAFAGFDKMMAAEEKRWTLPKCHFTRMSLDQSDDDKWWECRHCGHTKDFGFIDRHGG